MSHTPLDPRISEFATQEEADSYDRWFRERIEQRLAEADTAPRIPHDQVMAEAREVIAKAKACRKKQA